jgi:iron complex outermembrane receptor protein
MATMKNILKLLLFISFLVFVPPHILNAGNTNIKVDHDDITQLNKLMSIIDKYSDLATKTRMNSDFVPGLLTVVTRNEMEFAGLKTVEEVLKTLAGIHIYTDSIGFRTISIRGIGGATASGNVKVMLNNISLTDSISSVSDFILDYPVELLQRIELIRGPGAAIYGEQAYTGVINVITRNTDSIVSFGIGSLATLYTSALFNYRSQEYPIRLSGFVHQFKSDGSDAITGPDAYHSQGPEYRVLSLAPGPTNERIERHLNFLKLDYVNTSFSTNFSQLNHGDSMGMQHYLYNLREDTPNKLRQQVFQLSQKIQINPNAKVNIKGGLQSHKCIFEHKYIFPPDHPYYTEFNVNYLERKNYTGFDFFYRINKHRLLFASGHASEKHIYTNAHLDLYRHSFFLLSQYEGPLFEGFSITCGLRYDNYNDVDNSLSPRFAGVYRFNSNHIVKCQYQEAFRPPTKTELVTSTHLTSSKIKTFEISYTYKDSFSRGRLSLYKSELRDVVQLVLNPNSFAWNYENISKVRARGLEIELEKSISQQFKLTTNASYMHTKKLDTGISMPLQAEFMSNAGFIYNPFKSLSFTTRWHYMGNRSREIEDKRSDLAGFHKVDASMRIHAKKIATKLRLGIDNVLNEDIFNPTATSHLMNKAHTYPGDYPLKGRTMWFDIIYEF